jgi:hypothetical protein
MFNNLINICLINQFKSEYNNTTLNFRDIEVNDNI